MTATYSYLPKFKHIDVGAAEQQITNCIEQNKQTVNELLENNTHFSWENLMQPLEEIDDRLHRLWSPISHLHAVVDNDELRKVYNACVPKLSTYATELGQNEQLYRAIQSIADDKQEFVQLTVAQQKCVENDLQDFRLAGVSLPEAKKQQYKKLQENLSELTTKFEQNLLDASDAWTKLISDEKKLAGLPEHAIATAQELAAKQQQSGWCLTLDFPCYHAISTYADDRALREEIYRAFVTRASDQGPSAGKWDNAPLMDEILSLRDSIAKLIGFDNYAELSLARKMANSPQTVFEFLEDLAKRAKPQAQAEYEDLQKFAFEQYGIEQLEAWDLAYYSEKLRQHRYAISQEDLRPYFPQNTVLNGMFAIVKKLYGITFQAVDGMELWHEDVLFFNLLDDDGELRGQVYMDLYARAKKRSGAWMDECLVRRRQADNSLQTPVAYLTCNFAPPAGGRPALFSHDEVLTLFHEFGHCLHHMLTKIECAGVSGINGVPWDAVELPSQFFENWCWEQQALMLISGHYQTGETLPADLYQKLKAAKNFQSAMQMVRQIEFSLFDFKIHAEYNPSLGGRVVETLADVRRQTSVVPVPDFNRFPNSFAHIFAGGYAAGYYSYKWAEVLSSDAFSKFEEDGIFNAETGKSFLHNILEQGGSQEPMDLFVAFRGREPKIDALLQHNGIVGTYA